MLWSCCSSRAEMRGYGRHREFRAPPQSTNANGHRQPSGLNHCPRSRDDPHPGRPKQNCARRKQALEPTSVVVAYMGSGGNRDSARVGRTLTPAPSSPTPTPQFIILLVVEVPRAASGLAPRLLPHLWGVGVMEVDHQPAAAGEDAGGGGVGVGAGDAGDWGEGRERARLACLLLANGVCLYGHVLVLFALLSRLSATMSVISRCVCVFLFCRRRCRHCCRRCCCCRRDVSVKSVHLRTASEKVHLCDE